MGQAVQVRDKRQVVQVKDVNEFKHALFNGIRVVIIDDKPMFFAKDIAVALEYTNTAQAIRVNCKYAKEYAVDFEELSSSSSNNPLVSTKTRFVKLIPESDVYRLIMRSHQPKAEAFQDWVVEEVLPSIRKTGGYVQKGREVDFVNYWMSHLPPEVKMYIAQEIQEAQQKWIDKNNDLLAQLNAAQPALVFKNAFLKAETNIKVGEFAKIISDKNGITIGAKQLYNWLRENNYIMKQSTIPYQRWITEGIFVIEEYPFRNKLTGKLELAQVTHITPKGQEHFARKLLKLDIIE